MIGYVNNLFYSEYLLTEKAEYEECEFKILHQDPIDIDKNCSLRKMNISEYVQKGG